MIFARARAAGALLLLGGCSYQSIPQAPPPQAALTAPARHVPGTWLVQVDTNRLERRAGLTGGFGCRAASYSVDASAAFNEAISLALARSFERTEPSEGTPSQADMRRARATGSIVVTAAQFEPRADIEQRGFGASVRATTTLAANVTVDREFRRAFEGTIEASGDAAVPIGMAFDCDAIRQALSASTANAVEQLAQRIAERLAGTPGIRPVPVARQAPRPVPAQPAPTPPAAPQPAPPAPAAPTGPATNTPNS
jgi:hypothetical protein